MSNHEMHPSQHDNTLRLLTLLLGVDEHETTNNNWTSIDEAKLDLELRRRDSFVLHQQRMGRAVQNRIARRLDADDNLALTNGIRDSFRLNHQRIQNNKGRAATKTILQNSTPIPTLSKPDRYKMPPQA